MHSMQLCWHDRPVAKAPGCLRRVAGIHFLIWLAGHTVTQLFTVPHDKKRKREEAEKAAAQPSDGKTALTGGEHAQPNPQFPISHYVLSYKVSTTSSDTYCRLHCHEAWPNY